MNTIRPVRTALCVYDALRLGFIVAAFLLLQPNGMIPFPWLALISPGAMFLLISLFWQFNIARYRIFSPLYLAGKGFSVLSTVIWLFYLKSYTIKEMLLEPSSQPIAYGIAAFLLLGDFISGLIVINMFHCGTE